MRRDSVHGVGRRSLLSLVDDHSCVNESPALPDDLHTLGGFFEAVAAHWKHRESELKRSEAFLAEAQRLSKTGSFSWTVGSDRQVWSEETFRIFDYERSTLVTLEAMLARVHPQDLDLMRELIAGVEDGRAIDHECRLLMPDEKGACVRTSGPERSGTRRHRAAAG